ncbi:PilN domain-containing protein [Ideonella sp. A 288]|uniref:PilN domain-containing protein n=1 Tax=Ideonella sp. A 288 TaxID=1962181 RepID=UPI000B4B7FAA|nr:PilN domain-containing protein [Ideonella sp. A 288]
MAQQINLADPRLLPQRIAFGSTHALLGALVVLGLGLGASAGLHVLAGRTADETRALQQAATALQAAAAASQATGTAAMAAEIDQLRQLEAGQRRIRAALDAGVAGEREGPASYFVALARQAQGSVWITGFTVADNGQDLELEGRMTDAHVLTDYLRRLDAEPRFKGRPFAQLSLNGHDAKAGAALPYTEFALRSRPPAGKGP